MTEQKHSACPFCGGEVDPTGWLRGDGVRGPECDGCGATAPSMEVWEQRAGLAQPFPAPELERPEVVAQVAFVLRNIGAMDAEDIDDDNVDLRFEDAEGRDTGCDVSIVEYAEKAADLLEQYERIVGALRADRELWAERWSKAISAGARTEEQRDAAQARVAELEKQEPDHAAFLDWAEKVLSDEQERLSGEDYLMDSNDCIAALREAAAPVAQAGQVPELDQLYSMLGADDQVDAAKKIAELVGCRLSRSALTDAQMRRLYENSTEAENERLGFTAFARLMRRAEAVHQIAAAPAQGGE